MDGRAGERGVTASSPQEVGDPQMLLVALVLVMVLFCGPYCACRWLRRQRGRRETRQNWGEADPDAPKIRRSSLHWFEMGIVRLFYEDWDVGNEPASATDTRHDGATAGEIALVPHDCVRSDNSHVSTSRKSRLPREVATTAAL